MIERTNRTPRPLLAVASALVTLACGSNAPDAPPSETSSFDIAGLSEPILLEASGVPHSSDRGALPVRKFQREFVGVWRTQVYQLGAWVDLIWVVGSHHAWHVVTAYADEALTTPLLRWDIVRTYSLGQRSAEFTSAYDLTWTDEWSSLIAYVDNDALFAQIGVADCALVPNVVRDTSTDNCGAPLFPFRECELKDFVELSDGRMTFGDPTQGNRCEQRPSRREAWSFERVRLTPELSRKLLGR